MTDFAELRARMVSTQIEGRGVRDPRVLRAFREVPREAFVAGELAHLAYDDHPLPIEAGQTISQPFIVAIMIEAAGIRPGDRVLEIGAGSGYAAALISRIAREIIAVERHQKLAELARLRMARLGYDNVEIIEGDGTLGWPAAAPFNAILAAASGRHIPQPLLDQLAPGGRLVMPLGNSSSVQQLVRVTRHGDGRIDREELGAVRFVPLIGEEGWSDAGQ